MIENIGFRYLLKIELLQTFSRISIVVFSTLGTFPQNGSRMFVVQKKFESYFSDRLTFSNIHGRTSR